MGALPPVGPRGRSGPLRNGLAGCGKRRDAMSGATNVSKRCACRNGFARDLGPNVRGPRIPETGRSADELGARETRRSGRLRSTVDWGGERLVNLRRIVAALALVLAISALTVSPAFADKAPGKGDEQ